MRIHIKGSQDDGYKNLSQYIEEFKARKLESLYFIKWIEQALGRNPTFKRCQNCKGLTINAFKEHYRSSISIDACHLKG